MTSHGSLFDRVRPSFDGELITPQDSGYDQHRRSFNAMLDRRPAVIALCAGVADVVSAVRLALEAGLPLAVRGGGHSVAGHALLDGGLVIDLRRMSAVEVDRAARRANAGGGATWLDMDTATQAHGLAVPGGVFSDTGVAGLTLGGGLGFLMGVAGLTCDNLVGLQLVTATGEIREVDAETDPGALWAHRGGGGNFGVVTRLDLELVEVGQMYGGWVNVPLDESFLERYAEVQVAAPDELIAMLYCVRTPNGPEAQLQLSWLGEPEVGRRYGDAIIDGRPILDGELKPGSYADIQAINDLIPFNSLRNYWKSTFVPQLDGSVIGSILTAIEEGTLANSGILVEPLHGQFRRRGYEHAAFPDRSSRFHVSPMGIWPDAADDETAIAWVRRSHDRIHELASGRTYVNYITPDEPRDRARSAYPPEVYERLQTVKRRLDPHNVFRSNINIAP